MNEYKRVALYFAPAPDSALETFGANWLGWDVKKGCPAPHLNIEGLPRAIEDITASPRKYGFHGTLKAPFRLAPGKSLTDLRVAVKAFCDARESFQIGPMKVSNLGQFIAVVPAGDAHELSQFAEQVVKAFEDFRAPLSEADITKRRKSGLTAHQDELMLKWGYPYIFDQFRFHLTLTSKLEEAEVAPLRDILANALEEILTEPVEVVDLCLYGERDDGQFEIIERFPLAGK